MTRLDWSVPLTVPTLLFTRVPPTFMEVSPSSRRLLPLLRNHPLFGVDQLALQLQQPLAGACLFAPKSPKSPFPPPVTILLLGHFLDRYSRRGSVRFPSSVLAVSCRPVKAVIRVSRRGFSPPDFPPFPHKTSFSNPVSQAAFFRGLLCIRRAVSL